MREIIPVVSSVRPGAGLGKGVGEKTELCK